MLPRSHLRLQTTWIAVMDTACLAVGCALGVATYFTLEAGQPWEMKHYVFEHMDGWFVLAGSMVLANHLAGAYRVQYTFSRFNIIVTWLFSLLFVALMLSILSYAWFFDFLLGRGVFLWSIGWYSIISLLMKILAYRAVFRRDFFLCRTAVVGPSGKAAVVRNMVENEFVLPVHSVVACIDVVADEASDGIEAGHPRESVLHLSKEGESKGVPLITSIKRDFEDIVQSLGLSLLVLAIEDHEEATRLYPQLRRLRFEGVEVLSLLGAAEVYQGRTPLDLIDEESLMQASLESGLPLVARIKRLTDIVVSLVAIVLFLPVALLIAVCIKMSAPSEPVIYSQMRVGQFGRLFRIFKFRTMRMDAENETGPVWAGESDPRITRCGRFLRRSRLDEVPQFWNVLKGEMSLVGPRPERPELVAELEKKIPFYSERANAMPGLTGWAQIRYPYGSSIEDTARKLEYDLYYIKHLSVSLDLQIVLSTLRIVVLGKERSL